MIITKKLIEIKSLKTIKIRKHNQKNLKRIKIKLYLKNNQINLLKLQFNNINCSIKIIFL